jgi:thiol-disulfide isomerase/thioredoxin
VISRGRASTTALAAIAIVAGAGVSGFLLHRLTVPERATLRPLPPSPAPAGAAQTTTPPAVPPSIPEQLPNFALPDMDGATHYLSEWRGRPLLINFWASWCEPCRREIPLLEQVRRENAQNKLEIVGIAIDQAEPVKKIAKDLGIDYPVLIGDKGGLEAVSAFGMDTVLPFTVFADAQGQIVKVKVGELHRDEATFILARLVDLSAGKLTLAAAREQIDAEIRRLAANRAK